MAGERSEHPTHAAQTGGSGCSLGCDDGLIVDGDTAYGCSCRAPRARAAKQRRLTERKRRQCRKAGRASGRVRRQLARGRRTIDGVELELKWDVRQVTRDEFTRLYEAMCAREGVPCDPRGENTAYTLYAVEMAAYRAQGQDFETTNGQRSAALSSRGRPRARRTVQRTRARLAAMGLVRYHHLRRSGPARVPGQLDTLRVHLLPRRRGWCVANDTPPSGAERYAPSGLARSACSRGSDVDHGPPDEVAPPSAADDAGAAAPPATEEEELERQLSFEALWRDLVGVAARSDLAIRRRARLRSPGRGSDG